MLLNLCILVLHSATLQNSLTIIIQTVISPANNEEIASLWFLYHLFIFPVLLNWPGLSGQCWTDAIIVTIFLLFLVLKNMNLIFHYYHDDYRILIWYFPYQVTEISFHFWFKSFIWNEYWFLSIFLFLLSYSLWSIDIVGYCNKFANLL